MRVRVDILLVFALLLIPPSFGVKVGVIKKVDPQIAKTGEVVNVSLIITNPFDKAIKVKIVDKSIIDRSGYDIQCLEEQVEGKRRVEIVYPNIRVYEAGNYTLGKAEVSYVNPSTGKEEKVLSNAPYVVVNGKSKGNYAQKTITTIYRCGSINIQSTSSSSSFSYSSTSFHISTSSSFPGQSQQQQVQQPMQGNQNIQAIKNALNKEIEKERKEREERLRNITNTERIRNIERALEKEGYKRVGASYNPNTKQFTLRYRNKEGKEAEIKGIYNRGKVSNVMKLTHEQKRKMLEELKKNKKYEEWEKKLRKEGYNLTSISYTLNPETNTTSLLLNYTKGDKQAQIIANYTNNTLKSIRLRGDNKNSHSLYKYVIASFALLLFLILLILFIRKIRIKKGNEKQEEENKKEVKKRQVRRKREAGEHIRKAERYLKEGKIKEAAEEISLAIRIYYSNIHGITKEVDSEEMIEILKEKSVKEVGKIKEILEVCDTVLFHPPYRRKVSKGEMRKMIDGTKKIIANTSKNTKRY